MKLSDWLKKLFKENGYSVEEIADKIGVGKHAVYRMLRENRIDEDHVQKLAEVLGVPPYHVRYGYQLKANPVSYPLLKTIVEGIEKYLDKRRSVLPPATKAALYIQLYDRYAENPDELDVELVVKILEISKSLSKSV